MTNAGTFLKKGNTMNWIEKKKAKKTPEKVEPTPKEKTPEAPEKAPAAPYRYVHKTKH